MTKKDPAESRRSAFVRLAKGRTLAAVDKIRLIGNLSNSSDYEYSEDDVALIFREIEDEMAAAKARFRVDTRRRGRRDLSFTAQASA